MDEALARDPRLADRVRGRARKKLISLRLPQWQIDTAKRVAKRGKRHYQVLMQTWIAKGLKRELGR
jgi:hypothetical protein